MEQEIEPKKLEIEKSFKEKLKLFMFIIRPGAFKPIIGEYIGVIVEYRIQDAIKKAAEKYVPQKTARSVLYTGNYIEIGWLMAQLKEGGMEKIEVVTQHGLSKDLLKDVKPGMVLKPVVGIEGFKAGLLMACEEFIKNEKDKVELKRIINTIKDVSRSN